MPARPNKLLQENLDGRLEFQRVSPNVNSPRYEGKPLPEVTRFDGDS